MYSIKRKAIYIADSPVGDVGAQHDQDGKPRLGAHQGLEHLVFLPLAVLDSCDVLLDTIDGVNPLALGEKPRL